MVNRTDISQTTYQEPSDRVHLTRSESQFVEAITIGMAGDAARMQQALRRSLRRRPAFLTGSPAIYEALVLSATQAVPPIPGPDDMRGSRDLLPATRAPRRVEGQRFSLPGTANGFVEPSWSRTATDQHMSDDVRRTMPSSLHTNDRSTAAPVLSPAVQGELDDIVTEHVTDVLARTGLSPTQSVLLTGLPGTGKTITARWIAGALGKPLVMLDLAQVMNHELGGSAKNLREALDWAGDHEVVLFIDEFDAIASARATGNDVGEVRRIVNVLLLALDKWPEGHLLIAATNHPELLDHAIERRFDRTIELPMPDAATREGILAAELPELARDHLSVLALLTAGRSGSKLKTASKLARRRAALKGVPVDLHALFTALDLGAEKLTKKDRDRVIRILSKEGWPARQVAEFVGVSHPTVLTVVKAPL
jgi:hypothetical protein